MNLDTLLAFKFLEKKAGKEVPLEYFEKYDLLEFIKRLPTSRYALQFLLKKVDYTAEKFLQSAIRRFSFSLETVEFLETEKVGFHIYVFTDGKGNTMHVKVGRAERYRYPGITINGLYVSLSDYKLITGNALKIYYFVERYLPSELKNYKEPIARTSGALKASGIVNDPKNPIVSFTFGRLKRSGRGKEGTLAELLPTLSSVTANNIERVAEILRITWDKLYVYNLDNEAMVAAIGKSADGRDFMYDKYGSGMGGHSVVRSGKTKVNASTIISGRVSLADFQ